MAIVLATAATSIAADLYVSTTGSDPVGCATHPNPGAPYLTIQKAVACASTGDVIHIAAGTYEEQVVVAANGITIEGAGPGVTTIRSPLALTAFFTTSVNNYPIVFLNGVSSVNVKNLTVDGFGRGNGNVRFVGVAFWNSSGTLENCDVVGVRDTPLSGVQHGVGVYAFNNTAGPFSIELDGVNVTDYQKTAIAMNANDNLTVDLVDCVTTGAGPIAVTAQNGIQMFGSSGTVTDCAIADVFYTGPSFTASGLLMIDVGSVTVSGTNPISDCQTAIYAQDTSADIGGANVSGSTVWGAIAYNTSVSKAGNASRAAGRVGAEASPFDAPQSASKAGQPRTQASYTVSLHDGCLTGTDATGTEGVEVFSAGGPLAVSLENLEIRDWDLGIAVYDAVSVVTANDNAITSNVTAGFDNTNSLAAHDAEWNWWGAASGPSGVGGGSGDPVLGTGVDFTPWRNSGTDLLAGCGFLPPTDTVSPVSPSTCLSLADSCATVDVDISRLSTVGMRGFSVTFQLSSELQLCGGLGSISEGTYLSSIGGTNFQVLANGGGSYTADCAILGLPCGATAATGNLFEVAVKKTGSDGTGTVTVTSVTLRDCSNGALAGVPGGAASVTIDNVAPTAVANLGAAQVKTGNDTDGTTDVLLTFTAPGDAAVVEVYRAGFGNYPEYDDAPGAGSVPATPAYPPGGPWTLTAVTASGQTDEVTTRDFWYYVVFTKDACGNVSAVSNKTGGTLNYHLGDVSNGITPGTGNNSVNTADMSLLGANYGIALGVSDPLGYLDVGPTTDFSVDARPTTDNQVQFEDLIVFAINYGQVSKAEIAVAPAQRDEVIVTSEAATADAQFDVRVSMRGTGRVQGLSARLAWDARVAAPIGVEPGAWLRALDGIALSAEPGLVDVALLGSRSVGLAGEGDLAIVRFRRLAEGDPAVRLAAVDARNADNRPVVIGGSAGGEPGVAVPRATALLANVPNPFNPTTRIPFTLAGDGAVDLAIYTADGRRVRTLAAGVRSAGAYDATWDGVDERGGRVSSGVYFVRLVTRDATLSRPIVLLK